MFFRTNFFYAAAAGIVILTPSITTYSQLARNQMRVVGSSTIYPFATTVAEKLGKITSFKTPVVESTGSGGGIKLFCSGVGTEYPDVTSASRRIKKSEIVNCAKNGVTDIIEVKIGYDGIVLAHAKTAQPIKISRTQIFLALAKVVPKDRKLVNNPYKTWQDIDTNLPPFKIEILGPPSTSGTRDAFTELIMDSACQTLAEFQDVKKQNPEQFRAICQTVREDGVFIEAGENDNLIVQKLRINPRAFGIFGFSFLDQNRDQLQGVTVDNQLPTFEHISSGSYPLLRSLYLYVKRIHLRLVPSLKEYITEFTSERALEESGYLIDKGLIPLPIAEKRLVREHVKRLTNLRTSIPSGLTRLAPRETADSLLCQMLCDHN